MADPFSVRVEVRGYETDTQGHLNQAVYLQYAEHARWALLRHGGIEQHDLLTRRVGPVVLETNIRYLRELRAGDSVDVECVFEWGEGRTFRVLQAIRKTDGTLSAEITGVSGVLDLDRRKLVADPREVFKELAKDPGAFGL